jgi:type II secretory pathway pseudopilin PulG
MKSRRHAFTLLELLVAVVLTLGMAAAMLSVTLNALRLWRSAQGKVTGTAQARLALDLIERDLQAGIFRPDGSSTWLAVDVVPSRSALGGRGWRTAPFMKPDTAESLRLLPTNPAGQPDIAAARFGLTGAWLRLVTTSVEGSGSLPVAVAYQIARRPISGTDISPANPADVRYTLYRSAVSADLTLLMGNNVRAPGYASTAESSGTARAASTLANPYTPGDTLVPNAIDLAVWLYVRDASGGLRRIFPADAADLSHSAQDTGVDATRFPEVADVMLRVLTEEGAGLIAAMEEERVARPPEFASDAAWWWAVAEAHSQAVVRRVELKRGWPR